MGTLRARGVTPPTAAERKLREEVETFLAEDRVKADPGRRAKSEVFPVMKLNLVQDFPTGIYDYQLMTSSFSSLAPWNGRPAGSAARVMFDDVGMKTLIVEYAGLELVD